MTQWINALRTGIQTAMERLSQGSGSDNAEALNNRQRLIEIRGTPGNNICADCGAAGEQECIPI